MAKTTSLPDGGSVDEESILRRGVNSSQRDVAAYESYFDKCNQVVT